MSTVTKTLPAKPLSKYTTGTTNLKRNFFRKCCRIDTSWRSSADTRPLLTGPWSRAWVKLRRRWTSFWKNFRGSWDLGSAGIMTPCSRSRRRTIRPARRLRCGMSRILLRRLRTTFSRWSFFWSCNLMTNQKDTSGLNLSALWQDLF